MPDHDVTCRRVSSETTAYLDDAMPARLRTTFEQHVLVCPYCVAHLEQVRVTRAVLASLGGASPPGETADALRGTIRG